MHLEADAAFVRGVDLSQNMLDRAREMTASATLVTTATTAATTTTAEGTATAKGSEEVEGERSEGRNKREAVVEVGGRKEEEERRGKGIITYEKWDLDDLDSQLRLFPERDNDSLDLVFSALTLHYLEHLPELVGHVYRVLKPAGGRFVFSVEHPVFTAPEFPGLIDVEVGIPEGGDEYENGNEKEHENEKDWGGETGKGKEKKEKKEKRTVWPLNDYQVQGPRVTNWFAKGVSKYHRTVATYVNVLLDAGFEITGFDEWCPTKEELDGGELSWLRGYPGLMDKPDFLLLRGVKRC